MSQKERINEIDRRLEYLNNFKVALEDALAKRVQNKWSEEGMVETLRKEILSRYGSLHKIKLAKLILNPSYNDDSYDYKPILLLLDKDMNEVEHEIDPRMFCPNEHEQNDYYRSTGTMPFQGSITIRYA